MGKKTKLQISVSDTAMNHINELVNLLPKKIINGKQQNIHNSHIIELYSNIIHNYFNTEQLSIEYKELDIFDGRRKNSDKIEMRSTP